MITIRGEWAWVVETPEEKIGGFGCRFGTAPDRHASD